MSRKHAIDVLQIIICHAHVCQIRNLQSKWDVGWKYTDKRVKRCDICSSKIGDEYHALPTFPALTEIINLCVPEYFSKFPSQIKFESLIINNNQDKFTKSTAKFAFAVILFLPSRCHYYRLYTLNMNTTANSLLSPPGGLTFFNTLKGLIREGG